MYGFKNCLKADKPHMLVLKRLFSPCVVLFAPLQKDDKSKPRVPRINGQIRARDVTVIDEHGKRVSDKMGLGAAIDMAKQRHMDLVEVSSISKPHPICKFMSSHERYEKGKKAEKLRKELQRDMEKEFRLGSNIEDYDLTMRIQRMKFYLEKGYALKLLVNLRRAASKLEKSVDKQSHVLHKIEEELKSAGRTLGEPKPARGGRALEVIWRSKSKPIKPEKSTEAPTTSPNEKT
jgi:translation initiation factor IF-3